MTTAVKCVCVLCRYATEQRVVAIELRCGGQHRGSRCGKLLAEVVAPPYRLKCTRCGYVNQHP